MLKGRVISCLVFLFTLSVSFCLELEGFSRNRPYTTYNCPFNIEQIGFDSVIEDKESCSDLVINIVSFINRIRLIVDNYKGDKDSRKEHTEILKKKIKKKVQLLSSIHGFSDSLGISVLTPLQILLKYQENFIFDERQEIAAFIVLKLAEQYPLIYKENLEQALEQDAIIVGHWEPYFKALATTRSITRCIIKKETAL